MKDLTFHGLLPTLDSPRLPRENLQLSNTIHDHSTPKRTPRRVCIVYNSTAGPRDKTYLAILFSRSSGPAREQRSEHTRRRVCTLRFSPPPRHQQQSASTVVAVQCALRLSGRVIEREGAASQPGRQAAGSCEARRGVSQRGHIMSERATTTYRTA